MTCHALAGDSRPNPPLYKALVQNNFGGRVVAICVVLVLADAGHAGVAAICDDAARSASDKTGVPVSVLRAITRSETGQTKRGELRPWPWTVNMEGVGKWFSSRDDALGYVRAKYDKGARSFDVGCFQINYRWHGEKFASINEMFDPEANALYAARFLKRLYAEKNDWSEAAGAYHSRTKKYSTRYRKRFDRILASDTTPVDPHISQDGTREPTIIQTAARASGASRENNYPFFQGAEAAQRFGSLVPLTSVSGSRGSLFAMSGG